jgi:energy-coupling factor transport system ATP-binding protein
MIVVENLYYNYSEEIQALRGISLKINDGELVAIMGENGAGKTTLIQHFNKLLIPSRGKVFVDGEDISKYSVASLSKKIGFVFQNSNNQLFSENVEKEIEFGLRNFRFKEATIKKRVNYVLKLIGLETFKKSSPFELSEGDKKRLSIASVLAWDPSIIILDEPTIAQDGKQKLVLKKIIKQLLERKKTVVVVTHDVEFVADLSPRIILMSRGLIIADGPAKTILTDFNLVKKAFLIAPNITQVFKKIPGSRINKDIINLNEAKKELSFLWGMKK